MIKLVDYFVVVGYEDQRDEENDHESFEGDAGMMRNGDQDACGKGTILQRFPMDLKTRDG